MSQGVKDLMFKSSSLYVLKITNIVMKRKCEQMLHQDIDSMKITSMLYLKTLNITPEHQNNQ